MLWDWWGLARFVRLVFTSAPAFIGALSLSLINVVTESFIVRATFVILPNKQTTSSFSSFSYSTTRLCYVRIMLGLSREGLLLSVPIHGGKDLNIIRVQPD